MSILKRKVMEPETNGKLKFVLDDAFFTIQARCEVASNTFSTLSKLEGISDYSLVCENTSAKLSAAVKTLEMLRELMLSGKFDVDDVEKFVDAVLREKGKSNA